MVNANANFDQAGDNARGLIHRTKQITRRRFNPEEKVRIVIEGLPASVFETGACAVMRGDLLDSRMTLFFCQCVIKGSEPWTQL